MTGGQAVIRSLKAEKVEHMFGLIGSATIEVFDALYEEKKCGKPAVVDIAVDPKALYSFRRDYFKHREK